MEQVLEQKKTNVILQFGSISALVYLLFFVVLYMLGADSFSTWGGFSSSIIPIVFAVLGVRKARKDNNGYLKFREALKVSFGILVLTAFVAMLFSYLLYNIIDPPFAESMTQVMVGQTQSMLEKFGTPQDAIDKAVTAMLEKNMFSFGQLFQSFMISCIVLFIIAVIISAIMKKNKPEFESQ